ncbi:hypothetical protein [Nocardia asiatica]|uniref:hypothetical protein n=1 Tax=Nocardia asiatica TaxID=209252 RepID=UPI003EDFB4B2
MGQQRDPVIATKIVSEVAELRHASIRATPLDPTSSIEDSPRRKYNRPGHTRGNGAVPVCWLYGMGVESTCGVVRTVLEPQFRPAELRGDLSNLIVLVAQTGDEWTSTCELVAAHVLPLLRRHAVRLVEVARKGPSAADGIVVLQDTREPVRLHPDPVEHGFYALSDEHRGNPSSWDWTRSDSPASKDRCSAAPAFPCYANACSSPPHNDDEGCAIGSRSHRCGRQKPGFALPLCPGSSEGQSPAAGPTLPAQDVWHHDSSADRSPVAHRLGRRSNPRRPEQHSTDQ